MLTYTSLQLICEETLLVSHLFEHWDPTERNPSQDARKAAHSECLPAYRLTS